MDRLNTESESIPNLVDVDGIGLVLPLEVKDYDYHLGTVGELCKTGVSLHESPFLLIR